MTSTIRRSVTRTLLVVGAMFPAVARGGETLESVAKQLEGVGAKLKSMSAKQLVEVNTDSGDVKMESHTTGKYEFVRKGDDTLWRLESETASVTTVAGNTVKMDQKATMICDGKFIYTISETMGQKSAMKNAVQKKDTSVAGKGFFDTLGKDYTLKLLPDDKVNGKEAFVVEAVPKSKGAETSLGRMHYFILKENGIVVKTLMFDTSGKPMTTVTMSDLKINPEISGERFKAPQGVKFMDTEAMRNRHKQSEEPEKKAGENKKP